MPRGPIVYSPPAGTVPQLPLTTIVSATFNSFVNDVTNTFNTPQPIEYGGTNATSALAAAGALQVASFNGAQTLTQEQKGIISKNTGQAWEQIGGEIIVTSPVANILWSGLGAYKRLRFRGFAIGNSDGAFLVLQEGTGGVDGSVAYFRRAIYTSGATAILSISNTQNSHQIGQGAGITANRETVFEGSIENFNKPVSPVIRSVAHGENSAAERTYIENGTLHNNQSAKDTVMLSFTTGSIARAGVILEGQRG